MLVNTDTSAMMHY